MENNLENKSMFFAQYYGQNVKRSYLPEQTSLQVIDREVFWIGHLIINGYLELKSLEDITEEDLNYCSQICFRNTRMTFASVEDYLEQNYLFGFFMDEEIDYLREKGYAVKWRGLSVEKLIEYGWVKLKVK
ncbi:hypothetical protein M2T28_14430 [Elizabethkingia miricola]|uniref:hypothetical protein n=1 Tax=Elizabethkingia miricola TaxID=172045 RepID=UPI00201972E0|nr:hypothetical protein [Elizabethkingia miricola]MCL1653816.1 hypothetical protein [Elizabethkingia miricola]